MTSGLPVRRCRIERSRPFRFAIHSSLPPDPVRFPISGLARFRIRGRSTLENPLPSFQPPFPSLALPALPFGTFIPPALQPCGLRLALAGLPRANRSTYRMAYHNRTPDLSSLPTEFPPRLIGPSPLRPVWLTVPCASWNHLQYGSNQCFLSKEISVFHTTLFPLSSSIYAAAMLQNV